MTKAIFEVFEVIAEELCSTPTRVITRNNFMTVKNSALLLDELKKETGAGTTDEAIERGIKALEKHFSDRDSKLPFDYEPATGRFTATDLKYLEFIQRMSSIRSKGKSSREFEVEVVRRLELRTTGSLHRTGHPRDVKKTIKALNAHLRAIGFQGPVLSGKEKDGGLDILWVLPIGPVRLRPMVSIQCKNGTFDFVSANHSKEVARRSLDQHRGLLEEIHVPCVVFNDYILEEDLGSKAMNFVPLGLSDLAAPPAPSLTTTFC